MPVDPRATVERAARELLRALAALPAPPTLRVAEVEGGVACLIQVWAAAQLMPTVGAERRRRASGGRAGCKADVLDVVKAAGRALTRKEVVRALRDAGKRHGAGTVEGAGRPDGRANWSTRRTSAAMASTSTGLALDCLKRDVRDEWAWRKS